MAFIGPKPDGMVVCHNDGDKLNNHYANLRYDTHKSNASDMLLHGTRPLGERVHNAKLTDDQVREIRRDPEKNGFAKYDRIAAMYSIKPRTARAICSRHSWKHIADHGYCTRRVSACTEETATVAA
jgi:hypothetical protein